MMQHYKWPSIGRFADTVVSMRAKGIERAIFAPKIKLHGANVAVISNNGTVNLQGRHHVITDDYNFFDINEELAKPPQINTIGFPVALFGEWAGKGCAKHPDVVSSIPEKTFFVFSAVCAPNGYFPTDHIGGMQPGLHHVWEPKGLEVITNAIWEFKTPGNVKVLPYYPDLTVTLYAFDADENEKTYNRIMAEVEKIGKEDPYIKETFGISGKGEGLVFQQILPMVPTGQFPMMFKAKSDHHDIVKRSFTRHEIVIPEDVKQFVDAFVTEARVEQIAVEKLKLEPSLKNAGKIISAVIVDVLTEGANEIIAGNLDKKTIGKVSPESIRRHLVALQKRQ